MACHILQAPPELAALPSGLPPVDIPYQKLEAVFNNRNLWVSKQTLDPARVRYDFPEGGGGGDASAWEAFVEPRMHSMGMPEPFYQAKRLSSKVAADRLRSMEAQVLGELVSQIRLLRSKGLVTTINKSTELVNALSRGLDLHEAARMGDPQAKHDLEAWQRDVKSRMPAGSTLKTKAFNYAYTDAKRIRKHLLSNCDYATKQDDGTEFALAVRAYAFHCGICSVWVIFGVLDTNLHT